jgi:hypothetical protein
VILDDITDIVMLLCISFDSLFLGKEVVLFNLSLLDTSSHVGFVLLLLTDILLGLGFAGIRLIILFIFEDILRVLLLYLPLLMILSM